MILCSLLVIFVVGCWSQDGVDGWSEGGSFSSLNDISGMGWSMMVMHRLNFGLFVVENELGLEEEEGLILAMA